MHNIADRYTGKDDLVMLVCMPQDFPAAGEIFAPYAISHLVAGGEHGSH